MSDNHVKYPATREDLFHHLAQLGIKTQTVDHPPVFSVAESSKLHRELPGGHTKNLFLKDAKGRLFLVIALTTTHVNLKALNKMLGAARFSFGKPELLMEVLGVPPGSVTAFALMNDHAQRVSVVVDQELMTHETINCHPLENTGTTNIAREDLLRFIRACGFEPRVLELTGETKA